MGGNNEAWADQEQGNDGGSRGGVGEAKEWRSSRSEWSEAWADHLALHIAALLGPAHIRRLLSAGGAREAHLLLRSAAARRLLLLPRWAAGMVAEPHRFPQPQERTLHFFPPSSVGKKSSYAMPLSLGVRWQVDVDFRNGSLNYYAVTTGGRKIYGTEEALRRVAEECSSMRCEMNVDCSLR
jgi:hypothetical protein